MVNPTEYISSNDMQKVNVQRLIDEFADELKTMSGKCMDIGCGPGKITKDVLLSALPASARMIGTDIVENMIEYANQVHGDKKRLAFEVLDVETKNLPKNYISEFDHIFSFHTLHWCGNIRQAFENIYKMLRPGGTMLVLFAASHDVFAVLEMMSKDDRYASYIDDAKRLVSPYQYSTQPQKEISDLLKYIGFQVHHCSHRDAINFDAGSFLSSIMAFTTFLDKMPQDRMEDFRTNFKREYMKKKLICKQLSNDQERTIFVDLYKTVVIYAKK